MFLPSILDQHSAKCTYISQLNLSMHACYEAAVAAVCASGSVPLAAAAASSAEQMASRRWHCAVLVPPFAAASSTERMASRSWRWAAARDGEAIIGVEVVHGGGVLVQPAHLLQAVDLPRLHQQAAVEPVLPRDQLPAFIIAYI
jgi:hypothetical protein